MSPGPLFPDLAPPQAVPLLPDLPVVRKPQATGASSAEAAGGTTGLFTAGLQGLAAADREAMAARSARFMRLRHPRHTAKLVVLDLDAVRVPVQARTVEGWLGGPDGAGALLPGGYHVLACGVAWGPAYWLEIAVPGTAWHRALEADTALRRIVRDIDALERVKAEIIGGGGR